MSNIDETKNTIAKLIQKYLEKQPAIILGTGATIPNGLPSMPQLAEHLKKSIQDDSEDWKYFLTDLDKTNDLEKSLQNVQLQKELVNKIINNTWELVNGKDLIFYKSLLCKNDNFPLKKLFTKLLQAHPKHLKVVTTNYDRVAEYAADLSDANIHTGFSGRYIQYFTQNYLQNYPNQNSVDIWKVHGSLDWFNKKNNLSFASPLAKEIPENSLPLIVTPGTVKYQQTHNEPYRTVMNKADEALVQASCFLCIGYGFNDEHVQPKLIQQVQQKGKPIVTITKNLSENGKRLLLENRVKSIVIEEENNNKTQFQYFEDGNIIKKVLEGNYWQLDSFLSLWL